MDKTVDSVAALSETDAIELPDEFIIDKLSKFIEDVSSFAIDSIIDLVVSDGPSRSKIDPADNRGHVEQ